MKKVKIETDILLDTLACTNQLLAIMDAKEIELSESYIDAIAELNKKIRETIKGEMYE